MGTEHDMQAVILPKAGPVALVRVAVPRPEVGEVLVRPDLVGVCGTDLHAESLTDLFAPPVVLGHEFVATIMEVDEAVPGFSVGDRVVINPNGSVCGTCVECVSRRPNLCHTATRAKCVGVQRDGGMAELCALPADTLYHLPVTLATEVAVWTEPLAAAVRATRSIGDAATRRVLVIGGGPVGVLAAQMARLRGAEQVSVLEPYAGRRDVAQALGFETYAPDDTVVASWESQFDSVVECSGSPQATEFAVRVTRPAGDVWVLGVAPTPSRLRTLDLVTKEVRLRGSMIYGSEFGAAIRLLSTGAIDVSVLSASVWPLGRFSEAFTVMRTAPETQKILLSVGNMS